MMRRLGLIAAFALTACQAKQPTPNASPTPSVTPVSGVVRDGEDQVLTLVNDQGNQLNVTCGGGRRFVWIDTKRPTSSSPPLRGVFGTFATDKGELRTELSWAAMPPSAWTIREKADSRKVAELIAGAASVTFTGRAHARTTAPLTWQIELAADERKAIEKKCS